MTGGQAIILGIVQGLTEYLPVSSSAHLVIVPHILQWQFLPKESFVFDVLVQLGTLLGVFAYFFAGIKSVVRSVIEGVLKKDPFFNEEARLGWSVALATIPAACAGLLFKERFALYFSSPIYSCGFLLLTGLFLLGAEILAHPRFERPGKFDALIIGCAQGLALFPGVSRSGATIAAGMACGLSRKNAAQFSFLMSIPIMVGASGIAMLDLMDDAQMLHQMALPLILGFMSAAFSGYLVIKWFMAFLSNQKLTWFALYCVALGIFGLLYFG